LYAYLLNFEGITFTICRSITYAYLLNFEGITFTICRSITITSSSSLIVKLKFNFKLE